MRKDGTAVRGEPPMRAAILSDVEIQAFTKFAHDYDIITDDEVGVRNANILCGPIINADSTITPQTLAASFLNVRSQLQIKSATYKRADELARNLSPEEQETYKAWAARQKMLIGLDGSPEGYQNVAALLGWMRGNRVTEHNLDLALSNITNNIQFGRIHFKAQPKADRSIVGGLINHSKVNPPTEGFMPRNQTNRTARQIAEDNRPKVETPPTPVSVNVEYQSKAEALQGRSHGQTEQARKFFVMVPGTTTIDWQQTHAARLKFLTAQAPLIRR
jgi:hypothetical protein